MYIYIFYYTYIYIYITRLAASGWAAWLPGRLAAWLPGYPAARLPGCPAARLPGSLLLGWSLSAGTSGYPLAAPSSTRSLLSPVGGHSNWFSSKPLSHNVFKINTYIYIYNHHKQTHTILPSSLR